MIVPTYWAEARVHVPRRRDRGAVTVRRYGWSDVSPADAQAMADARAQEACAAITAGQALPRFEPKRGYNGADGVPIREEVLERHGEEVITRNAYGAHCLNSPRALFADIDFVAHAGLRLGCSVFVVLALGCAWWGIAEGRWLLLCGLLVLAAILAGPVATLLWRLRVRLGGGPEPMARRRISDFLHAHPDWALRLYRTPAGLRLLATHRGFDASSTEVEAFFAAVGADPVYVHMCQHQRCFRARVTGKPWRMGIGHHMRPRPGTWPVHPERRALRERWVAHYEQVATAYAACRYVESLGSGRVDDGLQAVIDLHDRRCRALDASLPMA